ncbi:MAG: hypothetical protein ACK413_01195 [Patescibacteria group bacterium]
MKNLLLIFLVFYFSSANWRQFQNDPAHCGKTEIVVQVERLLWSKQIPPLSPFSGPAVKDSFIFVPTSNGLFSFSIDGESLWTVPGSFENVPAIYDSVIIVTSNIFLCAFSFSGNFLWRRSFQNQIWHPVIWDTFIFITEGNRLWKLRLNGDTVWFRECSPGFYNAAPAIDDSGRIFVATLADHLGWFDFRVYGFNQNGDQIFFHEGSRFPFVEPGGNQVSPTLTPTGVVFATYPQTGWFHGCYLINFTGGSQRWEGTMYHSSAACDISQNRIYYVDDNKVVARNLSGNLIWQSPNLGRISYSSPAIDGNGKIFIGNDFGIFYILNLDGTISFSYNTGSGILTHPAITSDGKVIITSTNGRLICFGRQLVAITEKLKEQTRILFPFGIYDITGQKVKNSKLPGIYFKIDTTGIKKIIRF